MYFVRLIPVPSNCPFVDALDFWRRCGEDTLYYGKPSAKGKGNINQEPYLRYLQLDDGSSLLLIRNDQISSSTNWGSLLSCVLCLPSVVALRSYTVTPRAQIDRATNHPTIAPDPLPTPHNHPSRHSGLPSTSPPHRLLRTTFATKSEMAGTRNYDFLVMPSPTDLGQTWKS